MRTETQGARPKCRGKSIATACGAIAASLAFIGSANAESSSLPPQPVISVSASATSALPNDRMSAWLRAEVDNADPVAGANEINTRMGKALARAKAVRGVDASTTSYTSYQISERNQPTRWRISQTLQLESSDFAALAGLVMFDPVVARYFTLFSLVGLPLYLLTAVSPVSLLLVLFGYDIATRKRPHWATVCGIVWASLSRGPFATWLYFTPPANAYVEWLRHLG